MTHPLHPSIEQSSYWPYEPGNVPQSEFGDVTGDWKLGLSLGGSVVLWPSGATFPSSLDLLSVYHHNSKEELEKVFPMLVLGLGKNPLHAYQDGDIWLLPLSWRSFTVAQVGAFSRIVHAHVTGGRPWDVAKEWSEEITKGLERLASSTD